jgi:hypothetical protein
MSGFAPISTQPIATKPWGLWQTPAEFSLSLDTIPVTITGIDADLLRDFPLTAETGIITITGIDAELSLSARYVSLETGNIRIRVSDIAGLHDYRIVPDVGMVNVEGLLNPSLMAHWQETVTLRDNLSQQLRTDAFIYDELSGFDMGPVVVSDPSNGLYARAWKVVASNRDMYLYGANGDVWTLDRLLTSSDTFPTHSVELTWDQNGRPFMCWEEDGMVWIYYYDPVAEEMTRLELCAGRTPKTRLDVRRQRLSSVSDILLFYLNDTEDCLEYRVQSDRYTVAYQIAAFTDVSAKNLELLAMASNWRLYLWYTEYDSTTETWSLSYWHSAPYPCVAEDEAIQLQTYMIRSGIVTLRYKEGSLEESLAIAEYFIASAAIRSTIHTYTMDPAAIAVADYLVQTMDRKTTMFVFSATDENLSVNDYIVQSASVSQTILVEDMDDVSLGVADYSIQSATVQ